MLKFIESEIVRRTSDIRDYVAFFGSALPQAPITPANYLNLSKGLVDVHLYGMIEYTVNQTVAVTINYLNNTSLKISELKPQIRSLVLDAEFSALSGVTSKRWDKRCTFFNVVEADATIAIRNDLMPTDGKNFTQNQLDSIRNTFCITDSLFHDVKFIGILQSIVGSRINVAHGNVSATQIGASLTIKQIQDRIDDTFSFCIYFTSIFENYLLTQQYKI